MLKMSLAAWPESGGGASIRTIGCLSVSGAVYGVS
jgi:hypothetical protein